KVGSNHRAVEIGDETELYRHEKRFFHPVRYSVEVDDSMSDEEIETKVLAANRIRFERVGQIMTLDLQGVRARTGGERFAKAVEVASSNTERPLVLFCDDPEAMKLAATKVAAKVPLLRRADASNYVQMSAVAKELKCPLVVYAEGLNELADLVAKVRAAGVENIVLDFGAKDLKTLLERSSIVRKLSVKKTFRGLGYPIFVQAPEQDKMQFASVATLKYAGIVSFSSLAPEEALPLFVLRQNIYTDPQVPIQVKPDLYAINGPNERSPIMFTTNFSLTYFTVMADVEKSKVPVWLQVVDTEGLSVLTAYAAGKLTAESVSKALDRSAARTRTKSDVLIIPGMVARMAAKLNEVTGMKVAVGPKESSGLPKFLKGLNQ
ncbi:MAG: acetyl-CoA decarbonylase/synthase complex subunit gamma, partial [Methanomassiliicoccales archaeon]